MRIKTYKPSWQYEQARLSRFKPSKVKPLYARLGFRSLADWEDFKRLNPKKAKQLAASVLTEALKHDPQYHSRSQRKEATTGLTPEGETPSEGKAPDSREQSRQPANINSNPSADAETQGRVDRPALQQEPIKAEDQATPGNSHRGSAGLSPQRAIGLPLQPQTQHS